MTTLEIIFAIIGTILSIIGIIVGIIGECLIKMSNKNSVKNVKDSKINIDNSIKNGLCSNDLEKFTSTILTNFQQLYEKQAEIYQENFFTVLKNAMVLMKNDSMVATASIDETWSLKFFEYSGKSSNKDIQIMWAKLLKTKITGNCNISMRTMEILSNLSPNEALLFEKITNYVISEKCIILRKYLENNNLSNYEEIQVLVECGLLNSNALLVYHMHFKNNVANITNKQLVLVCSPKNNQNEIAFDVYGLTRAGYEIYKSLGKEISNENFTKIAKWIKSNNPQFNISLHNVDSITQNIISYNSTDIIDL